MDIGDPNKIPMPVIGDKIDTGNWVVDCQLKMLLCANEDHVMLNLELNHNLKVAKEKIAELEHIIVVSKINKNNISAALKESKK